VQKALEFAENISKLVSLNPLLPLDDFSELRSSDEQVSFEKPAAQRPLPLKANQGRISPVLKAFIKFKSFRRPTLRKKWLIQSL
jgi:hypothetical protein